VTLNLAIGQGENSQTLANMMRFYAMLANATGAAPTPSVVKKTSGAMRSLGIPDADLVGLRSALLAVVEEGTAAGARVKSLKIAGKTGTAQNSHGPDHGWFVGFAPVDSPRVVVGAIIEFAEHGTAVAPLVTRVIARHLLGADSVRALDYQMVLPADSAPEPVPQAPIVQPDTAPIRPPIGGDYGSRGPR
jgi:penicillin-binding protein 2